MPETPSPDLPSTVVPDTPSPQPAGRPQEPRVGSDWLNQLRADQRLRWEQGERIPVEAYLEAYPALKSDPESVLDLIVHEVQLRRQRQEDPSVDDFVQRFPQHADTLRSHFSANTEPGSESRSPADEAGAVATPTAPGPQSETVAHQPLLPGGAPTLPPSQATTPTFATGPGAELPAVAGYKILGVLGQGGMGVVYQAEQKGLKRLVALKMILAGPHARPEERARFRIEAEAVARLQHPNIAQIYEVNESEGRPYLSLEFVEGGSLAQRMRSAPPTPQEAARLIETLARAVQHAHERRIIHRDLKPGNVLLTAAGVPKIVDFGLAKHLDGDGQHTTSGAILGTPSYMAPEQASGKKRGVGPAADIYALGAILFEMVTGQPPFRGETPLDTVFQVTTTDPPAPTSLKPTCPRDLETIILKCLEKDPRRRYGSAAALADDLHRFLASEPIQAQRVSLMRRGLRWAWRRPAEAIVLALIVCVALALVTGEVMQVLRTWLPPAIHP
jgi:eukaryotic-like serine/threonine-protein kinase